MKKIAILCAAFAMAALGLTSCQKDNNASNIKFTASMEQAGNSKLYLDENLNMCWTLYDYPSLVGVATFDNTGRIDQLSQYGPTSVSDDGTTAVLEYFPFVGNSPFAAGTQGPFYAFSQNMLDDMSGTRLNADGSLHIDNITPTDINECFHMPMVARANSLGELHFKHLCGLLKIIVNLPYDEESGDLYSPESMTIGIAGRAWRLTVFPALLKSCDVAWDAHDNITLSNIACHASSSQNEVEAYQVDYTYYLAMPVGDISNLSFSMETSPLDGSNPMLRTCFRKEMTSGQSIHIERAGITTLTINFTEQDMVGL